jgi:hypothetical protein
MAVAEFEASPDTWVERMVARDPGWLQAALDLAIEGGDPAHAGHAPISERIARVLSQLDGPRQFQAQTATAAAQVRNALEPDDAFSEQARTDVRDLSARALAGEYGELSPESWGALADAWTALAASESESPDLARCEEIIEAMVGIVDTLKKRKAIDALLEVGAAALRAVRPEPCMSATVQQLLLRSAAFCGKALYLCADSRTEIDVQRLQTWQRLLSKIPEPVSGSARAGARETIETHLSYLARWQLLRALQGQDRVTLDLLQEGGFDLRGDTSRGVTNTFGKAIKQDRFEEVGTLLDFGLDPNVAIGDTGKNGLHKARSLAMVELLVSRGANVRALDAEDRLPSEVASGEETRARLRELEQQAAEAKPPIE